MTEKPAYEMSDNELIEQLSYDLSEEFFKEVKAELAARDLEEPMDDFDQAYLQSGGDFFEFMKIRMLKKMR